jgi:SAM-dependent methyltransferase
VKEQQDTVFRHVPCDLCGTRDFIRLGTPKSSNRIENTVTIPQDVSIVRCKRCGFYYTDPMPLWREQDLQNIYDATYFPDMTRWWKRVKTKDNPQRRLDNIEKHATDDISQFLEVGCGLGYGLEEAMRRGWTVNGQEVSQFFAEQVESRLGTKVFVGQLEDAHYPENYFDVVYVDSVLEHLPQPVEMLTEIHRILKPHGIAYITVTNEDAFINKFRGLLFKILQPSRCPILSPLAYPIHLVGFTPDTLKLTCRNVGFEVKSIVVCAGTDEWRKFGIRNVGCLLRNIMYYPAYFIGEKLGKGIAIEALITARKQ